MDKTALIGLLKENGVVGAGGAGFPTYGKIDERAKTIILNCCECEPLLRLHRQLLEKHTDEILNAFETIRETIGAENAVIGIKKAYVKTIEAIKGVIDNYKHITVKEVSEIYPAGDEVVLIYEVTGKVVKAGGLPIESGVAVFNVETVYNLAMALKGSPVTSKVVTVACEVKTPKTVRVPLGMELNEVVKLAGGEKIDDAVYLVGGPMMGNVMPKTATVTKTTNAILVLSKNHYLINKKNSNNKVNLKRAAASCCQCNMCTDLCPRHLLGHPIDPARFMRAATCNDFSDVTAFVNTMYCSGCGLCEMYSCMQGLSPRTLIGQVKGALRGAGIKPSKDVQMSEVSPQREFRKAPVMRLEARLDLARYDSDAPFDDVEYSCEVVKENLSQHIGAPSVACVKMGDKVQKGEVIAKAANGLSVNIHASIDGLVTGVTDKYVEIKKVK